MGHYSLFDGISMSIFLIIVVFIVLVILAFIIELLSKFLSKFDKPDLVNEPVVVEDDQEEQLVVRIIAGIIFQKESDQDVVIKSIKRVR